MPAAIPNASVDPAQDDYHRPALNEKIGLQQAIEDECCARLHGDRADKRPVHFRILRDRIQAIDFPLISI